MSKVKCRDGIEELTKRAAQCETVKHRETHASFGHCLTRHDAFHAFLDVAHCHRRQLNGRHEGWLKKYLAQA